MKCDETLLEEVAGQLEKEAFPTVAGKATASGLPVAGAIGGVMKGLAGAGLGFLEIIQWARIIIDLIKTVGPEIQKIIDLIRDAINRGEDPHTFRAPA